MADRTEIQRERARRLRTAAGDQSGEAPAPAPPAGEQPTVEPEQVEVDRVEIDLEVEAEEVEPAPTPRPRREPPRPFRPPRPSRRGMLQPLAFVGAVGGALARDVDLPSAVESAAGLLPVPARRTAERIAGRLRGDYAQDEWGYDEEFVELVYPFFEFMYERWWRVEATGVSNLPAHGSAMVVANHAGVLPWDATMMSVAVRKRHPAPRQPRFMVLDWAFRLPWVSSFMRRVGGVVASPYNAMRLLGQGHLVMVFPEGAKGAGKPFSERYRLQRFGRGGFVEIALRTGAPIIPVAVVGSEEIYPKLGESRLLARLLGAPYFPITPTFPALGAIGAVPLPSKWRIEFCPPLDLSGYGPEAADDRASVFEISEQVRETIQERLLENLVKRGSAFI